MLSAKPGLLMVDPKKVVWKAQDATELSFVTREGFTGALRVKPNGDEAENELRIFSQPEQLAEWLQKLLEEAVRGSAEIVLMLKDFSDGERAQSLEGKSEVSAKGGVEGPVGVWQSVLSLHARLLDVSQYAQLPQL